jgi:hypothetical protein
VWCDGYSDVSPANRVGQAWNLESPVDVQRERRSRARCLQPCEGRVGNSWPEIRLNSPSAMDLDFLADHARYDAPFIPHCTFMSIPSLWGHPAGAGAGPEDDKFLNQHIAALLKGEPLTGSS